VFQVFFPLCIFWDNVQALSYPDKFVNGEVPAKNHRCDKTTSEKKPKVQRYFLWNL
jgi:hypothetical protein